MTVAVADDQVLAAGPVRRLSWRERRKLRPARRGRTARIAAAAVQAAATSPAAVTARKAGTAVLVLLAACAGALLALVVLGVSRAH